MRVIRRFLALSLVIAVVTPLGPVYAAGDHFPGPDYTSASSSSRPGPDAPPTASGDGTDGSGLLSTVPSYDDELDDGYTGRWNGLPAQVFSPDGDGVQDTVTFTWEETYPGRPEIPPHVPDPGDTEPPVEGQPAIPPGADTSLWVMKPIRKAGEQEQHWCVMPTARVGPGEVSFTWDGTAGGRLLGDDWYYWYTKRIDPETGEEEISPLGRVLIDTAVTELRKVLTLEATPGQLAIRIQGHDERSGIKTVEARILPGQGRAPVWSGSAAFDPPNWRWWPDQEWARFTWPIPGAGLDTDYALEVAITDFGGNSVTERVPLWPPVSRTGEEAFWTLAEGKVLGEPFAVNAGSGNLVLTRNDLWLPGFGPSLGLTRTYSSQLRRNGAFGWGFASNYEERIEKDKVDGSLIYTDPDGSLHVFDRAAGGGGSYVGLPVVNPPGIFFRLEVIPDPNGRDESYRITHKDGLVAEFNIHGRLVARRDRNGNTMAFAYYDDGNLARATDASGRSLVFTYEGNTLAPGGLRYAKVASVEEELLDPGSGVPVPGRKVSFVYSPAGDLVSATDLGGVATSFQWDDRHRLGGMTVSRGGDPYPITMAYDARNALVLISGTRDDGVLERWTGDLSWAGSSRGGGTYLLSDPLGTYTYGFNGAGNVTSLGMPEGGMRTYVWAANLLRSSTDGLGNATLFGYDDRGNPTTVTEPEAEPTECVYDANNDLRTVIDPLDRTTSYEYDGSRNLTRIIDGRDGVTVYKHYPNGLVREETQPGRVPVTYVYDDQGNLLSSDDGRALTTCVYDLYGNATLELVAVRCGSGQSRTETHYDLRGNALWTLDPVGVTTTREYDENGYCTRATIEDEGGSTRVSYEYDASLNLRRVVEEYTVTEWLYDAAGNCTERLVRDRRDPEGFHSRIVYAYNGEGQCVSTTSPLGAVTSFDYDLAGRLEAESTAILGKTYEYDTRGNLRRVGDTENGLARYDYNNANERMSATVYRDGLPQVTSFTYDGVGGLESVGYPGGHLVYYVRDTAGDVTDEIHYGLTATTPALTLSAPGDLAPRPRAESCVPAGAVEVTRLSYGYDDFGNVTSVTDGEGNSTTYTYDYLGHRSSQTDATGITTSYQCDSMGRLLQSRDRTGLVTWYRYNRLDNVVAEGDQEGSSAYIYDEQGRLRETHDRGGGLATYTYDAGGNRLSITQEVGDGRVARRSFTYDAAGNVISQLDGERHLATFGFDEFGRCRLEQREGLNDEQAVENHFEYDGKSRTTSVVDARDNETRLVYDTFGNLVARYEPAPVGTPLSERPLTTYQYDDGNRLSALTDPMGATTNYEYDVLGNQTAVVDACGARTELEYDRASRVKVERRFLDEQTVYATSYDYDGAGRLTAVTDANGHTSRTEYDGVGRVEATFDALGHRTSYEYDPLGRLKATVDPLGRRTTYAYDPMGRVIGATDPLGSVRSFGYNKLGDRTSVADAEGRVTRYGYDLDSRLVSVTDPRLLAEGFSYDGLGNKMSWTTSAGDTMSYRYDPRSNLSQVAEPGPAGESLITVHDYDPRGNHVSQLDPEGRETSFKYDLADRLVVERSDGLETTYHYDATGNRVEAIDGRGLTSYVYDLLGRVIEVHYPGGEVESFAYDGVGNLLSRTDSSGTTIYGYDAADRLKSVTDPTGTTAAYEYDPAGNLVGQVVDEQPTSMKYDAAGRLRAYTDQLGYTYGYDYDQSGLLTRLTGPSYQTGWAYGANGRPTGVETATASGLAAAAVYVYDDRNFVAGVGEDGRQTSYRYDARGQLTEVVTPAGDVIRYGFDGSGNRTRREAVVNGATTDRGQTIEPLVLLRLILKNLRDEHPDVLAQYGVRTASGNSAGSSPGGGSGPDPEAGQGQGRGQGSDKTPPGQEDCKLTGRENALTRGNGLKIGLLRKFEADEHGIVANIIMILERIVNGETHVPPGDMTGLETIIREAAAAYTLVGQESTYNELNQMTSVHDPLRDETFNYTWDKAGALVQAGTADLTWDEQGRLARIVWADGWGIEFTYDAQGRRLTKTTFSHQDEGRQTTAFHYLAGGKQVLWEEGPHGRLDYTYDPTGRRLTITREGETYWYVYNGHGDVVALVNGSGALAARYEYDDYGRVLHMWGADGEEVREGQGQTHYLNGDITVGDISPEPAPGGPAERGTAPGNGKGKGQGRRGDTGTPSDVGDDDGGEIVKLNPYRYAGYRYDRETELYFLESRYYDSWSNRFIGRDSEPGAAAAPLSLNRYIYALNGSPNFADPLGTTPVYVARNIPRTYDDFYKLNDISRIKVVQAILISLGLLKIPDGPVGSAADDMEKSLDIDAWYGPNTAGGLSKLRTRAGVVEPIGEAWNFYMGEQTYRALLANLRRETRLAWWGRDRVVRYSLNLANRSGARPAAAFGGSEPCWPLDPEFHDITSAYGKRDLDGDLVLEDHYAIDLAAPFHARVYAVKCGFVRDVRHEATECTIGKQACLSFTGDHRGNFVLLEHTDGSATRYLHLTASLVSSNDRVATGQIIGTVGSTGKSTGPHLHLDWGTFSPGEPPGVKDPQNPIGGLFPSSYGSFLHRLLDTEG